MGKLRGFIEIERVKPSTRPIVERLRDWREFELPLGDRELRDQGARCMDCGIPFCHDGCPLGNLIPDWNDHVYNGRFDAALRSLSSTNNFPEVTGRVCPAPCEAACVLNLENKPVTIKTIERDIVDRAWDERALEPRPAPFSSGKRVAVVGSGPAGLATAQQLARRGHAVTVFEQSARPGGLLRYGIPDFKLDKALIDRRVEQMTAEGVRFRTGVRVGSDVSGRQLRADFDAIVLCGGAGKPRDLPVPGRELAGVHFAMDFLTQQNERVAGLRRDEAAPERAARIWAGDRRVIVLGGGDTGSDCVGTSLRQGAVEVLSLELMPRPPEVRAERNPWPQWPLIYRTSSSHEEGGRRDFAVMTKRLVGDDAGHVRALEVVGVELHGRELRELPGSERTLPCDLLLLAMGFTGPVSGGLFEQLGVALDARGNVGVDGGRTNVAGIFAAGDVARGQSLVVWAIAEGRKVAVAVDQYLASR